MAVRKAYLTSIWARSAVRLHHGDPLEVHVGSGETAFSVAAATRYFDFDGQANVLPGDLVVEVRATAESMQDAIQAAYQRAGLLLTTLSVAANAGVEDGQVEFSFECEPGDGPHEHFQNFVPQEAGLPPVMRVLDPEPFLAFLRAVMDHPERTRMLRACAQYQVALQHWTPGHEVLALAHLFMAMEALTPVVRDAEAEKVGGLSRLEDAWGLRPPLCAHCGEPTGRANLDAEVRRRVLFRGEDAVYAPARRARNGFQHGFMEFEVIQTDALAIIPRLGELVRHAIFDVAEHEDESDWRAKLATPTREVAMARTSIQKYVHSTMSGDLATGIRRGSLLPQWRWSSDIQSVDVNEQGGLRITPVENVTKVLPMGVEVVGPVRFEFWGPPADSEAETAATPASPPPQTDDLETPSAGSSAR